VLSLLSSLAFAASMPHVAAFDWVEYRNIEAGPAPKAGEYRNPILSGFYPDPSIVKVGAAFYLVNSTFSWFPGIPVWHSRDLVHWRQIGNAIDRPSQLSFTGLGMSRGVYAPDISFHEGRFYIVNTCVDCGGNFVITARDPAGPWSQPVWLKDVEGIDPSLFFDEDGSAWLVNNRAPEGGPTYSGHRAIWLQHFDLRTLQTSGAPIQIVNGGVDISQHPSWIEGPHLLKKDGAYYLMAAEGGTAENHSEVIFRAERIEGPYAPAPAGVNPILTQRGLDPARPRPVTSAGHADLVRLDDGRWWAVFLATRPYSGDLYNTGRETFLLPVEWAGGWPTILPPGKVTPTILPAPRLPASSAAHTSGSFVVRDDFSGTRLGPEWMMMRTPGSSWWTLHGNALRLSARNERIGDGKQPSFVGRRQQSSEAIVTTSLRFMPAEGEAGGLAAVQNDAFFLSIALTRTAGRLTIQVARRAGASEPAEGRIVASVPVRTAGSRIGLRIHAHADRYDFDFSPGSGPWQPAAHDVDATNLATAKAGGFVGTLIGPFAQSSLGASPVALKQ
jgi:xylan 1,4-beta-xylosidase